MNKHGETVFKPFTMKICEVIWIFTIHIWKTKVLKKVRFFAKFTLRNRTFRHRYTFSQKGNFTRASFLHPVGGLSSCDLNIDVMSHSYDTLWIFREHDIWWFVKHLSSANEAHKMLFKWSGNDSSFYIVSMIYFHKGFFMQFIFYICVFWIIYQALVLMFTANHLTVHACRLISFYLCEMICRLLGSPAVLLLKVRGHLTLV